jgi:hypothetical protein
MEIIAFLQTCNTEDFIKYSKDFNVFKTTKESNYLLVKDTILSLLVKHNLTIDDIRPNIRTIDTRLRSG